MRKARVGSEPEHLLKKNESESAGGTPKGTGCVGVFRLDQWPTPFDYTAKGSYLSSETRPRPELKWSSVLHVPPLSWQ
jgi:hypothetical protein